MSSNEKTVKDPSAFASHIEGDRTVRDFDNGSHTDVGSHHVPATKGGHSTAVNIVENPLKVSVMTSANG